MYIYYAQSKTTTVLILAGGAYPVGGASEIAFHIIPVIEAAGGKVLVRAEVDDLFCVINIFCSGVR